MKRFIFIILLLPFALFGQERKPVFQFSMVKIDSTYNHATPPKFSRLIEVYRPEMERRMMAVVGYAPKEMRSFRPESPLSNFAVDALLAVAGRYTQEPIHFSLTNFGGLRSSLPKGEVRLYDIYAIFPFENELVILELEGKDVWELFSNFARTNRVEAVGNVKAVIENRKLIELSIAGQPFDPNKRYRMATIDFLLGGGDSVAALKNATAVIETGLMIRDVVVEYISMLKSEGKSIEAEIEGRVKVL